MAGEYHDLRASNGDENAQWRYITPVSSVLSAISTLSVKNEGPRRSRGLSCISQAQRRKVTSNLMCAICFEDLVSEEGNIYTIPGCSHKFHEECLRRWKREKATCPFCRGILPDVLGETSANIDLSDDMDYIVRRLQEIIQEMEGNPVNQPLPWKTVLVNIILCPFGVLLPPLLLVLLWIFETISFGIGAVVLPFYMLRIIIVEINVGSACKKIGLIFAMFVGYPFFIVGGALILVVLQFLYSILLSVYFYIGMLRCQRRWTDAYKVIVQGTFNFLEEKVENLLPST